MVIRTGNEYRCEGDSSPRANQVSGALFFHQFDLPYCALMTISPQKLEIMETQSYGRMLCLDGIIQLTEKDEFSYQEMLAFLPLFSHPNPKKVCVVGGGDGAILSRLVMHPQLEEIFLCELDERVIECSKKFFPQFRRGFDDPRVTILTSDGAKFLSEYKDYFDVIITDSSDPIGK